MAYEEIVTSSRKINNKALDADVTLTADDVGAANKAYVDAVKRPYLVNFTKSDSSTNYTADKTLQEIYDAVQAGHQVYGYIDTNGYWAYIPLGSCFIQNSNIYLYFEGPFANGNGKMVATNKLIQYISLTALNNSDTTSKEYSLNLYNAVSSSATVNKKKLNGDIILAPSDIGSSLEVTFTLDETTSLYTSNKTLSDIYIAYYKGGIVYGVFENEVYALTKCYSSSQKYYATFTLVKTSGVMPQGSETKFESYGGDGESSTFKKTVNYFPVVSQVAIDNNTAGYVYMYGGSSGSTIKTPTASDVNAVPVAGGTMTGDLNVGSNAKVQANGYITGTWLRTTADTHLASAPTKVAVINDGWIYDRTPAELKTDMGITDYVLPVASSTALGGVKPIARTSAMAQDVGVDSTGKLHTKSAVGTTTDYSIYIGSTAPAANTTPLIWIDTSSSGVMKYRTSTSSTTWTAVPVAWG